MNLYIDIGVKNLCILLNNTITIYDISSNIIFNLIEIIKGILKENKIDNVYIEKQLTKLENNIKLEAYIELLFSLENIKIHFIQPKLKYKKLKLEHDLKKIDKRHLIKLTKYDLNDYSIKKMKDGEELKIKKWDDVIDVLLMRDI
jgi:hypothetical protein